MQVLPSSCDSLTIHWWQEEHFLNDQKNFKRELVAKYIMMQVKNYAVSSSSSTKQIHLRPRGINASLFQIIQPTRRNQKQQHGCKYQCALLLIFTSYRQVNNNTKKKTCMIDIMHVLERENPIKPLEMYEISAITWPYMVFAYVCVYKMLRSITQSWQCHPC